MALESLVPDRQHSPAIFRPADTGVLRPTQKHLLKILIAQELVGTRAPSCGADRHHQRWRPAATAHDGDGVPKNPALALSWAQKSAVQKDPFGEQLLGEMYRKGIGTAPNPMLATIPMSRNDKSSVASKSASRLGADGLLFERSSMVSTYQVVSCWCYRSHRKEVPKLRTENTRRSEASLDKRERSPLPLGPLGCANSGEMRERSSRAQTLSVLNLGWISLELANTNATGLGEEFA